MRVLIQRVKKGRVEIKNRVVGSVGQGLLVFLGIAKGDTESDCEYLFEKVINLRLFEDENRKMNKSVLENKGDILVVSQFTLYADCQKGRRPGFDQAMPPQEAHRLYQYFIDGISSYGLKVESGEFQATMQVHLVNDGPVTLLLESKERVKG